jgi:hypothetical protein
MQQEATHTEATNDESRDDAEESSPLSEIVEFVELGIQTQMKERPYVVMAGALGLGYVLGGGLPNFAVKALSAVGLRYVATKYLKNMFPGG